MKTFFIVCEYSPQTETVNLDDINELLPANPQVSQFDFHLYAIEFFSHAILF